MRVQARCFVWSLVLLVGWAGPSYSQGNARDGWTIMDPEKVLRPEKCGECHKSEYAVWAGTKHATGLVTMHRKASAEKIAERLGFRPVVKRESACLQCHYTPILRRDRLQAGAGVSCESCHGAARDWIDIHNLYGVAEPNFQKARVLETAEHKAERIARTKAAGMRRPSELYDVVATCYQCHAVPHEKLVNVGRHMTSSPDFELVSWLEDIRHNFLESFVTADGAVDAERPPERKRVVYVVGRALDLEYSLRGLALATEPGPYLKAMIQGVEKAVGELQKITVRASLPEVSGMLAAVDGAQITVDNEAELLRAADTISEITKRVLATHDGTRLGDLDSLVSAAEAAWAAAKEENASLR